MNIFSLVGSVMVDNSEANKSISKTKEEAGGMAEKLKDGIGTAAKWAAGIGAAAAAVGGAMVAAAKDTAADLDVIDKASQRMGIAAEQYQELAYAAGLSGVEMSTMEKAAKKLEGTDLNLDDALTQILAISDESERAAAASELFGESVAYQMTPLLNAGAEGMAAMRQEANDLGMVIGQDAVTQGAAMNDMFSKVEGSIATLKNGLVSDLMPYVMEILQWVIDNIPMIRDTIKGVMDAVIPIVKPILDAIMQLLPPLLEKIKAFIDWITPYITPIINGIGDFVSGFFALLNGDTDAFIEGVKSLFVNLGTALFGIGKDILTSLWDGMKEIWEKVTGWIGEKVEAVKQKFRDIKDSISGIFSFGGKSDGSHAAGLNYVPYDGYQATLHRGETVLSAQNTQSLVSDIANAVKSSLGSAPAGPINLQLNIDGKAFAYATYDATRAEAVRRGASFLGV